MKSTNGSHTSNRQQQIYKPIMTTFIPILCSRSTLKNVHLPNSNSNSKPAAAADRSSPKIGCMGQINGFSTPHRLASSTAIKYQNLKRIFSGKRQTTATNGERIVQSCREVRSNCRQGKEGNSWVSPPETDNVDEMDPPLPVVQPTRPDGGREEATLWKRRSPGIELKSLEITA